MRNRFLLVLLLLSELFSYSPAQKLGQLNVEANGVGKYPPGITGTLINPFSPEPSVPRQPHFKDKPKCPFGDSLECAARDLAGEGAVNCGRVRVGMDATLASNCALKAFVERKPFRVRYDVRAWNSENAISLVRTADGRVFEAEWDKASGWFWQTYPYPMEHVSLRPCGSPTILKPVTGGRLGCRSLFERLSRDPWPAIIPREAKVNPADWY